MIRYQTGYGTLSLTASSPAQSFTEPLSVAEMAEYLGLPQAVVDDQASADSLSMMITAAREMAELFQNADLVEKQWDIALDYWPVGSDDKIDLRGPLNSVDLVKYRDSSGNYTTLAENADYVVDTSKSPGIIVPMFNRVWPAFTPWPSSAVLIRFSSGLAPDSPWWLDSGARVKIGMKLLIVAWWENRIPFELARGAPSELPYTVTACLSYGSTPKVH